MFRIKIIDDREAAGGWEKNEVMYRLKQDGRSSVSATGP
jgi:hypothetical protein